MTIAALLQARMLQTLLQALQSSQQPPQPGETVEARLIAPAGDGAPKPPEGHVAARALLAGAPALLFIKADPAQARGLTPGARLTLTMEEAARPGEPARMRLVALAPPPPAPTAEPPTVQTLRAAAGPMIGATLARQQELGAVLADALALLRQGAGVPAGEVKPVPAPVLAAALKLAGLALKDDAMASPEALQRAVAQSGLFHEARQQAGGAVPHDLKSALQALLGALKQAQGDTGAGLARAQGQMAQAATPSPPLREAGPVPQPLRDPPLDLTASALIAKATESTQGALDRIALNQYASLPAPADAAQPGLVQRWSVELPLLLEGRAGALPLQIEEEDAGREGAAPGRAPGRLWRVRFAFEVEELGPLHAVVTMQGKAIGVTVWAARPETSRLIRRFAPELEGALRDHAFERADVEVLAGQPQARAPTPGRFLDRAS